MEYFKVVMMIFGGLGALLIGIHTLSDNLTKIAHSKLRTMLNKTAGNRFAGVGIGAAVTVIGQSSAFTTIMVVGLVNAGVMTLFQATAIIMGANVGTTLTLWVLSLGDVVTTTFLCTTAIGVFMGMFSKNEKVKSIGNALASFGLIFVGLKFMSLAFNKNLFPDFVGNVQGLLTSVTNLNRFGASFLLLFIGILMTALVQSSTAVNSIIIAMMTVTGGGTAITGNAIYFLIIGANIGTCVTALISSFGANPNAKRAALIHFMFNFFGALIFTVLLLAWEGFADTILVGLFKNDPNLQIAMFHTLFNLICTVLFLPCIKIFVKIANFVIRDKKEKPEKVSKTTEILAELDERLMRTPSVALGQIYQGAGKLLSYAMETMNRAFEAFVAKDLSVTENVQERNVKLINANRSMVEYLVKLSATSLVMDEEKTVSNLHYVLNDIVRVGEIADNFTKYTAHYVNDNLVFSDEFIEMITDLHEKTKNLYALSLDTFLTKNKKGLSEVDKLEDEIDNTKKQIVTMHIQRLNEGKCQPENSSVFINLVGNLERAADHITFIAHSIE
ncbi:MAG: Na/Pi cotransporter family protein [Clostridia bacterium]|nr:Na/Pi cotransporter family protein [Clostridia bacterium]